MRFLSSFVFLAGAALGLATPVMAQSAPVVAAPAAEKAAKPKKVCRVDPTLGSMMPRYVCHSKEEWAAIDKATQQAADGAQNGMGTMNTGTRNGSTGN